MKISKSDKKKVCTIIRGKSLNDACGMETTLLKLIDDWKLDSKNPRILNAIISAKPDPDFLPMSNFRLREASHDAMVWAFQKYAKENGYPDFWLGTFCWDEGVTWEREPQLELNKMHGQVFRALNDQKLNAVLFFELSPLEKLPGDDDRRLLFHVHAICWPREGKFKPKITANKLSTLRKFPNMFDAKAVKFTRKKLKRPGGKINAKDFEKLLGLAGYCTKVDGWTKRIVPRKSGKGHKMQKAHRFSGHLASRIAEVLSQITVWDAVHGVGDGSAIRKLWQTRLMDQLAAIPGKSTPANLRAIRRAWANARKLNGPAEYLPCTIKPRYEARVQ